MDRQVYYLKCDISDGPFKDVRFVRFRGWLGLVSAEYLDMDRGRVEVSVEIQEGTFYGSVPGKMVAGRSAVIRGPESRLIRVDHIDKDSKNE